MGEYIGRRVNKEVKGAGTLSGIVKSYKVSGFFEIVYDGGDSEVIDLSQLLSLFNGSQPPQHQQVISTSKVGRKPKKRPRISPDDNNNAAAVGVTSGVVTSNLDLNNDLNTSDGDGPLDFETNQGFNLDLNEGVDLNIDENMGSNAKKLEKIEMFDLNVDANGDVGHVSEYIGIKGGHCFDLNLGLDEECKNTHGLSDETSKEMTFLPDKESCLDTEGRDEEKVPVPLSLDTCLTANVGTLQDVQVQWTTPTAELQVQNGVLESSLTGKRGRKKRKLMDAGKSVAETVLRRSARRARIDSSSAEDHLSCALVSDAACDPLLSPSVSVVSEEKIIVSGHEESGKHFLPPKMDLPPSSSSLDLNGIPALDIFSVYAFLRSFNTLLFLSPFELEDFAACIKANAPTLLFDSIHFSLLQILRNHLESLSDESSESASNCLRSLNWDLLDLITWPVYMVEYLLLHGTELKPSFDLCHFKLLESNYYNQPASLKVEILRCLCDDVIEVEAIRAELNRRTVAAESMDLDRNLKFDSSKKRRAAMDDPAGVCLTDEVVDESTDWNSDECCLCKMDGNLICCDGCPAAFHSKCVGVASNHLPDGDWYCPECQIDKKKPWLNLAKAIRGAELLATDPYGRLYYSCCSYLLVSDPWEDEFSLKYYHRNDWAVVIGTMKSSKYVYETVISAVMKLWDRNCLAAGEKCDLGYVKSETVNPSMKMSTLQSGSDGSAEISQAVVDNQNYKEADIFKDSNCASEIVETSSAPQERNGNEYVDLGHSTMSSKRIMSEEECVESYVNYYSFARMASSVVEELAKRSPGKSGEVATKTEEEIISAQLKVISSKSFEFCWPSVQNLNVDVRKEKCGWCYTCRVPECERDCLFDQNNTGPALENFPDDALGGGSLKSHLVNVLCYILSIEDRLHGLLLGPWLNPHHSQNWRKDVLKAHDIAALRAFLLTLESNLRPLALTPDWLKHVDSLAKMGSGHHIVINSPRGSSRNGIGKKKARHLEPEVNPSSNAGSGLGLFWWRGGRLSRRLFNWKVLPQPLASKSARQGGFKKIPGMLYPDSSDFAKRSKCISWRAAVETSRTVEQFALQVRDLDAHVRWNDIGNTNILATIDKEFQKAVRSFKKVIVRKKSSEGSVAKYLLDFGKRRFLPDIVVRCGTMLEEASNERKRYWLEESHMPLHLVKGFEEKRIARKSSKMTVVKHSETNRTMKKPLTEKGFSYLFLKAERSEYYQCGHCSKDVVIREAVSCQYCEGFFHKRHVRKSAGVVASKLIYTCHKCADVNHGKQFLKRGRIELRKSKKASKALRSPSSTVKSSGTNKKQPAQSQSSKKEPVALPLRRSARRVKFVAVQNKKVGPKSRKQIKAGRGRPKKQTKVDLSQNKKPVEDAWQKPAEVSWQKKRMQLCRIYWLNGLLLSQKPIDERVTLFRSKKLLLLSGEMAAISHQPKCGLCGELEYEPTSDYISCEVCGDWFHGDAFNLTAERITKLIGFKCHKCRQRNPPFCAHLHSKVNQVVLENTERESANEACNIESHSSKEAPIEQKSHSGDESVPCFTGDSDEKHSQGTLPDSCHAENGCLPIISQQRETIDSCGKMDIVLLEEPDLLNDNVNCTKREMDRRPSDQLVLANDSSLLNDQAIEVKAVSVESGERHGKNTGHVTGCSLPQSAMDFTETRLP